MGANSSKTTRATSDQKLLDGCQRRLPKGYILIVNRRALRRRDIVDMLEQRVDAAHEVLTAKAQWHGAVRAEAEVLADTRVDVAAVRQAVLTMYGTSPEILAEFGLAPQKGARHRTLAERADAVEKAKATRRARRTTDTQHHDAVVVASQADDGGRAASGVANGIASVTITSFPPSTKPPA